MKTNKKQIAVIVNIVMFLLVGIITSLFIFSTYVKADPSITLSSISPSSGTTKGGQWVTITGTGFPSNSKTSNYVQDGLVAHFDGIDNIGEGDMAHESNTSVWKDLSQSNADLTLNEGDDTFLENGFVVKSSTNYWYAQPFDNLPSGNSSFTVEVRYTFVGTFTTNTVCTVFWGGQTNNQANCTGFRGTNKLTHAFWGNDINIDFPNAQSSPNTLSITYEKGTGTSWQEIARKAYGNSSPLSYVSYGGSTQWQDPDVKSGTSLYIGGPAHNNTNLQVQSVRIYNRPLSQTEITENYEVDQNRFISPPQVTIGGNTCTNLTVVSSTQIKCKTPANSDVDVAKDVEVSYGGDTVTLPSAYTYKDPSISTISPNQGPIAGGNSVTITGSDFPYAATDDYIQDGLVAHFDGIDNTGRGDMAHDDSAKVWKDLSSTNIDMNLCLGVSSTTPFNCDSSTFDIPSTMWSSNHVNFLSSDKYYFQQPSPNALKPQDFTIEAVEVLDNSSMGQSFNAAKSNVSGVGFQNNSGSIDFQLGASGIPNSSSTNYSCVSTRWCNAKSEVTQNTLTTLTGTFSSTGDKTMRVYNTGNLITTGLPIDLSQTTTPIFQDDAPWTLGGMSNPNGSGMPYQKFQGSLYSARIYNKVLSEEEIVHNSSLDQLRFINPPQVTIGGNQCTNLALLSSTELRCTVPAGTAGAKDVVLTYEGSTSTLSNAYTYIDDPSYTFITSQTPYIGKGGDTLSFQGQNLNTITSIKVGENTCPIATQSTTSISCSIPNQTSYTSNKKDIVIDNSGTPSTITLLNSWNYETFLTISLDKTSVSINPNPSTSDLAQDQSQVLINTNNPTGYNISFNTNNTWSTNPNALYCTAFQNFLLPITQQSSTVPINTWGYKFTDPTIAHNDYYPPEKQATILYNQNTYSAPTGDTTLMYYASRVDMSQSACGYSGNVLYTVVANF